MSYMPEVGSSLIFMKIGVHAKEPLEDIIARKHKELKEAGVSFWGYGGNTCHPTTMVQPFVRSKVAAGQDVYLCMHSMVSNHWADPVRAEEYSEDNGKTWKRVPSRVNVLGSRYALVLESLEPTDFELKLGHTRVGYGMSQGKAGLDYVRGRVDKACLTLTDEAHGPAADDLAVKIGFVAKLAEPYAVLLR